MAHRRWRRKDRRGRWASCYAVSKANARWRVRRMFRVSRCC
jgi:hypothetical protein